MSSPVVCIKCGAVSYNEPGKTPVHCQGCVTRMTPPKELLENAEPLFAAKHLKGANPPNALELLGIWAYMTHLTINAVDSPLLCKCLGDADENGICKQCGAAKPANH